MGLATGAGARSLLALVVVAVLVILALSRPRARDLEAALTGFWAGDPEFMAEAGLSDLYLYLAPASGQGERQRQGYLVMAGDGRVLSNQGVEVSYSDGWGRAWSALKGSIVAAAAPFYRIRGVAFSYSEEAAMPPALDLLYDAGRGTLTLHSGEKVWLRAFKDAEASAWAAETYAAPLPPHPSY